MKDGMYIRSNVKVDKDFVVTAVSLATDLFESKWVALKNGNVVTTEKFYTPYDYKRNGEVSKTATPFAKVICKCATVQIAEMIAEEHNNES